MITSLLLSAVLGLVPIADNLSKTGAAAEAKQLPIMLYVSRSDCTFCKRFEKQQLGPLLKSNVYTGKIIFRELIWDARDTVIDFDGKITVRAEFAEAFDAKLTPTLLFLDGTGKEIAPRITGYNANDYFGYYFEAAIDRAIKRAVVPAQSPEGQ